MDCDESKCRLLHDCDLEMASIPDSLLAVHSDIAQADSHLRQGSRFPFESVFPPHHLATLPHDLVFNIISVSDCVWMLVHAI